MYLFLMKQDEMEADHYTEDDEDDQYPPPREKDIVIFGEDSTNSKCCFDSCVFNIDCTFLPS